MKNFKQLIKELPSKKVVFAFGRFQPPTTGHELLVKAVKKLAGSTADHVIYASKSEDKKSNPLPVDRKVYYLKRMFPQTNFVAANAEVRTFIEAAKALNKKYKNIVMVAGSDRVAEYTRILNTYNGKDFHFDTIEVVSAGERDPDSDSASGMSGTKMREAAKEGNFTLFKKGVPQTLTDLDARRLMNDIRVGMGLEVIKESVTFERTKIREQYVAGKIFNIGDKVKDENGVYEIMDRGANYITVVNESGELSKKFLDKVKAVKSIKEDITGGNAPAEISFKGYTSKNLHHSPDAVKAFQDTIVRQGANDPVAVLNALKATDAYMKLNDLHLEQDLTPDQAEVKTWVEAHMQAKASLERVGEFLHHMDYWDDHGHELQMLFLNYKEAGKEEFQDSFELEGDMIQEELKFAAADKVKVARIIAATFGVENAEKATSPEQLVNNGLRKIRNKSFTPDMAKVVKNMLDTARLAGIDFDEKLLPTKVAAVAEQVVDKSTNYNIATDILRYKDYQKLKAASIPKTESKKPDMQRDDDDMDPNDADDKVNQSDQDSSQDVSKSETQTVAGNNLMATPYADSNVRRQKIRYALGEGNGYDDNRTGFAKKPREDDEGHGKEKFKAKSTMDRPHTVHIDGKPWKKFSNGHQAHAAAKTLTAKGKKATATAHFREQFADFVEGLKPEHNKRPGWMLKQDPALAKKIKDQKERKKYVPAKVEEAMSAGMKLQMALKRERERIEAERKAGQDFLKKKEEPKKTNEELSEGHVEFRLDHRDKVKGDHKPTFKDHEATVSDTTDKATYVKVPAHKANSFKTVMKNKHGVSAELSEEVDLSEDIKKEYDSLKKNHDIKSLRNLIKTQHKIVDTSEFKTKEHAISHYLRSKHGNKKVAAAFGLKEDIEDITESMVDSWKKVQSMDKGSVTGGKEGAKKRLAYLHAVHDHHKKFGNDIKKVKSDIENLNRSRLAEEETVEHDAEDKEYEDSQFNGETNAVCPDCGCAECECEEEEEQMSDEEIDQMIEPISSLEDIAHMYDDGELEYEDEDTGEVVDEKDLEDEPVSEEAIMEVLSRQERMRQKIRFAKSSAKRKRSLKISLRTHSSTGKLNQRARRLAIQLIKQRIAKKPLNTLSIGEKERLERIIQKRKAVINRVAMKLTARVRKIENDRISGKKKSK